eukprot:1880116-Rhodomonas_salina.1
MLDVDQQTRTGRTWFGVRGSGFGVRGSGNSTAYGTAIHRVWSVAWVMSVWHCTMVKNASDENCSATRVGWKLSTRAIAGAACGVTVAAHTRQSSLRS